jgi:hypothetical protein
MAHISGAYITSAFLENTLVTIKRGVELANLPPEFFETLTRPQRILVSTHTREDGQRGF